MPTVTAMPTETPVPTQTPIPTNTPVPGTLSGVILIDGRPAAGVVVNGGPLGTVVTDADGHYTFTGVEEGVT